MTDQVATLEPLPSEADRLIPARCLPRYLGVSAPTLERWRMQGTGPKFVKAGRRVFYRVRDVQAWLQTCQRASTMDPGRKVA